MTKTVVVGAGVVARACALALADAGSDVILVGDVDTTAGSASAAAGAMLGALSEVQVTDSPERTSLEAGQRWEALGRWPAFLDRLAVAGSPPPAATPGLLVVASSPTDLRALAAMEQAAADLGAKAERLDATEVPWVAPDRRAAALGALLLPEEGSVAVDEVLAGLRRALVERDKVSLDPARAVGREGTAVRTADGLVAGDVLVLAPGGPSELLADPLLGLPPVLGGRGVSVTIRTHLRPPMAIRTPNRAFACGTHVVPRGGGLTYLGATNRLTTAPDAAPTPPTVDELRTVLDAGCRELHTGLRSAALEATAVGLRPVTGDRLPLVGPTAADGVLVATGTYRNGVLLAPHIAALVASEVAAPGALASHPFRASRPHPPVPAPQVLLAEWSRALVEEGDDGAPGRDAEMEALLVGLARGLDNPRSKRAAELLVRRAPMPEVVPLLAELLRRGS